MALQLPIGRGTSGHHERGHGLSSGARGIDLMAVAESRNSRPPFYPTSDGDSFATTPAPGNWRSFPALVSGRARVKITPAGRRCHDFAPSEHATFVSRVFSSGTRRPAGSRPALDVTYRRGDKTILKSRQRPRPGPSRPYIGMRFCRSRCLESSAQTLPRANRAVVHRADDSDDRLSDERGPRLPAGDRSVSFASLPSLVSKRRI